MSAPAFTPGPWALKRMAGAEEHAAMMGETLAEHKGYYRTNSGAWIVTFTSADEDMPGGPVCEVSFKGSAKRGEMWCAPDPEGQANARLIAAAPELLGALDAILNEEVLFVWVNEKGIGSQEYARRSKLIGDARSAQTKARGETL